MAAKKKRKKRILTLEDALADLDAELDYKFAKAARLITAYLKDKEPVDRPLEKKVEEKMRPRSKNEIS
jgi:hypothetical protein